MRNIAEKKQARRVVLFYKFSSFEYSYFNVWTSSKGKHIWLMVELLVVNLMNSFAQIGQRDSIIGKVTQNW